VLITHGTLITCDEPNRIIADGALRIEGDVIAAIGTTDDLVTQFAHDEIIDARGQLVLPGNICSHTHFYGMFARGMALRGEPPKNFVEILEKLWWRLDKALTLDDVRYSVLPALEDAIRSGTTCLIDHHASPNAIAGSLDVIAECAKQAGMRVACAYEVTDRDGAERAQAGIAENVRFIRAQQQNPHPLIGASFGMHASFTLSARTLEQCVDAAAQASSGPAPGRNRRTERTTSGNTIAATRANTVASKARSPRRSRFSLPGRDWCSSQRRSLSGSRLVVVEFMAISRSWDPHTLATCCAPNATAVP